MLKHAVLARILVYLARKESPFRFIDTHAGAGRFDLMGPEAKRSPEWREGIARILTASPPAPVAELLRPYLEAVGPQEAEAATTAQHALATAAAAQGGPVAVQRANARLTLRAAARAVVAARLGP